MPMHAPTSEEEALGECIKKSDAASTAAMCFHVDVGLIGAI